MLDMCPHRHAPLSLGKLVGDSVQCGYHGITFDCTGKCVRIPGESRILEVDARDDGRIDAAAAAQVDHAASSGRGSENGRHAAAYVAGSIGIAGLAVGVVTGLMTMQAANTYKDHCVSGQCDSDGLDAASTGRTLQVVSPIGFVVGAIGIGTGAWLWFTAPSPTSARAFVAPAVAPGTAGVSLRGAF